MQEFLPISQKDMQQRRWQEPDFILITGDAYVDHPSFGAALISRLLESRGYKIAVLSQPNPQSAKYFRVLGKPRLGFLITAGNIDSMVNNYTVSRKKRTRDVYSPGGKRDLRPDRAAIVYSIKVREAYGHIPIILGGLEASLRRLAHYDYWTDKIRRSILMDSNADLVVYGMGERAVLEIAAQLNKGIPVSEITSVRGTVYKTRTLTALTDYITLPAYESLKADKQVFAKSFLIQYHNNDYCKGKSLVESYGQYSLVQHPPAAPLSAQELDEIYEFNYAKDYHPIYKQAGGVPALEEVQFSLTSCRGCFGNCHFCSLTFHQGRLVHSRSHESLIREAKGLTALSGFKGYIHDVGGPTANFRHAACTKQLKNGSCTDKDCLVPSPCKNLIIDHSDYLDLLLKLKKIKGVKKVFVRSGLRFDYMLADPDNRFFTALVKDHISGQLKVAPEHISDHVLKLMNKTPHALYEKFKRRFYALNKQLQKTQYLVPYFMSGHPGSTLHDAIALACYFSESGFIPEQVQDFYPTPGTVSTCMYYTGINPRTGTAVYVPKSLKEKAMQRALMHFNRPGNYRLVRDALLSAGRKDLIGFAKSCLIRPYQKKKP
ncbi:MAG: YgiQ family radical SAM protein [Spirochaetales bacterium]|nr:YgiQ family radical SAM protein [Spirochaetales bacterium]